MRSRVLRYVVVPLAAGPLIFATGASAVDSTVGQLSKPDHPCGGPYTYVQVGSSGASYAVPSSGVITRVQISGDTGITSHRAFKLARPAGGGYYVIAASTAMTEVARAGILTQFTRIPAKSGDLLGLSYGDATTKCSTETNSVTDAVLGTSGDAAVGTLVSAANPDTSSRLPVTALVEPDADGDGFGDTTQDKCATQANTQGQCNFSLGTLGAPRGSAKVGKKLTAPTLTVPAGATKSYQWYRIVKVKKHHRTVTRAIAGARGTKYKVKKNDKGTKVLVRVTVREPGYNTVVVSSRPKRVH